MYGYFDSRDIVKWATLDYLTQDKAAELIVQVAFYRDDPREFELTVTDGNAVATSAPVKKHIQEIFPREIRHILDHTSAFGTAVRVVIFDFERNVKFRPKHQGDSTYRADYFKALTTYLKEDEAAARKKVVLLDPDTGMEQDSWPGLRQGQGGARRI